MGQSAVRTLHREGDASRIMRCALLLRRHGSRSSTEVALGAEGGFVSLAAAPGRLQGGQDTFLGELLVHFLWWGSPISLGVAFPFVFSALRMRECCTPAGCSAALQT